MFLSSSYRQESALKPCKNASPKQTSPAPSRFACRIWCSICDRLNRISPSTIRAEASASFIVFAHSLLILCSRLLRHRRRSLAVLPCAFFVFFLPNRTAARYDPQGAFLHRHCEEGVTRRGNPLLCHAKGMTLSHGDSQGYGLPRAFGPRNDRRWMQPSERSVSAVGGIGHRQRRKDAEDCGLKIVPCAYVMIGKRRYL